MAEGGVGWVNMLADRVDYVLDHSASGADSGHWRRRPEAQRGARHATSGSARSTTRARSTACWSVRARPRPARGRLPARRLDVARHPGASSRATLGHLPDDVVAKLTHENAEELFRNGRHPDHGRGSIVDGTGGPGGVVPTWASATAASSRSATSRRRAARRIDATGLVVAPGFVDIHTHYDAQLFVGSDGEPVAAARRHHRDRRQLRLHRWRRRATSADYLMRMMARVEGMPLDALRGRPRLGLVVLRRLAHRLDGPIGVNAGFLVGHSAVRRAVMGDDGRPRAATAEQIEAMVALLPRPAPPAPSACPRPQAPTHNDADGEPVPSRAPTRRGAGGAGGLRSRPPGHHARGDPRRLPQRVHRRGEGPARPHVDGRGSAAELERPRRLGGEPRRPRQQLAASDHAAEQGAGSSRSPCRTRCGSGSRSCPGSCSTGCRAGGGDAPAGARADAGARRSRGAPPAGRGAPSEEAGPSRAWPTGSGWSIVETFARRTKPFEGRTVGDVAPSGAATPSTCCSTS